MRILPLSVVFFGLMAGSAPAQDHLSSRSIVVTGEGIVATSPDMASIQLGVTHEADTASDALAMASQAMTTILSRLGDSGIEQRDVQTTNISLSPRYDRVANNNRPNINGYIASNMVSVRVRDLDNLGDVLDGLVSDGANAINGISFSIDDVSALEADARLSAVMEARGKAETLAAAAGVTLGNVRQINESEGFQPQPMMRGMAMAESSVPIAGGEVEIRISVTIIYDIAE